MRAGNDHNTTPQIVVNASIRYDQDVPWGGLEERRLRTIARETPIARLRLMIMPLVCATTVLPLVGILIPLNEISGGRTH